MKCLLRMPVGVFQCLYVCCLIRCSNNPPCLTKKNPTCHENSAVKSYSISPPIHKVMCEKLWEKNDALRYSEFALSIT